MPTGLQIGKVARQTGFSVDAIRFYEKQRLLARPARTEGGFRLFQTKDIQRLEFIRRAQQLGFSLPEIRELMLLHPDEAAACSHVRDLLQAKVRTVREKIRALTALDRQLKKSLRECERNLDAAGNCHPDECPVLREAAQTRPDES